MKEFLINLASRACLVMMALALRVETSAAEPDPAAPRHSLRSEEILNFALLDYKGKYHELRRVEGRAVVLFFTGNGCPIARQSIEKLKALRKEFSKNGVSFWMIDANSQDDRKSIEKEAIDFKADETMDGKADPLPILIDDTQEIARLLGVKRTAETICLSTSDWTVFYRGAIDDQLVEGAQKPDATVKYVEGALNEFLAGKPISHPKTTGRGCLIAFDDAETPAGRLASYNNEVAPLLKRKCVQCHSAGNIGPFAMSSYQKVKGWSETIREVLLTGRMPPWNADPFYGRFQHDPSLSLEEKKMLLRWIDQGTPRDNGPDPLAEQMPSLPEWPEGQPDYIVRLPEPQQVPAIGVVDYRYVDVPSPLTNDAWLAGAVIRPDNRKVVHHVIVRVKYPEPPKNGKDDAFLTGWAPGSGFGTFPEGTGKFLGKGATLAFELHYNTSGKPEKDQSRLGLYLLKSAPKMPLETRAALNLDILIPSSEPEVASFAIYGFDRDSLIFDLAPHMHLRGTWFKYEALYPNGERETLLSVPRYDFNWQTLYRLAEPKRAPRGTWILCTGGFDNSAKNPSNPNPGKRVRWGEQSFDEMFIGFMNVAELPLADSSGAKPSLAETAGGETHAP